MSEPFVPVGEGGSERDALDEVVTTNLAELMHAPEHEWIRMRALDAMNAFLAYREHLRSVPQPDALADPSALPCDEWEHDFDPNGWHLHLNDGTDRWEVCLDQSHRNAAPFVAVVQRHGVTATEHDMTHNPDLRN